jgi:hypothetical protein
VWGPASLEGGDEGDEKHKGDWLEGERVLQKGVGDGVVGAGVVGAGSEGGVVLGHTYREAEDDEWL